MNSSLFAFCFGCEILLAQRPVTVATMAASAGNFNFAVQGETHVRTFGSNGNPYASTVSEFGFYRSHCKWFLRMRTHLEGDSQTPGIRESETQVGCDGTNIFVLIPTGGTTSSNRFDQSAQITPGSVPWFGSHGGIIWLTFAAGCALDSNTKEFRPIYEGYEAQSAVEVLVSRRSDNGDFLERVDFLAKHPSTGRVHTNASFVVTEFATHTNSGMTPSRLIPQRAYLAVSNVLGGKPYLAELQELIVERVSDQAPARFTPDLDGRSTLTVDARFIEQEGPEYGIRYLATRWLPVDEVKELPSFGAYFQELQKRRLNKRPFEQTGRTRSGLFWVLFIFLAIAPVVILLLKGRGSGGGNQQTHHPGH